MTRADWLLLLGLCFAIGALFQRHWMAGGQAQEVVVRHPAGSQAWPLGEDRQIEVDGPLGSSVLEIHDGAVRFVSSPCRHKVCVRSGWHRHAGAVAACVPNRISLMLSGGAEAQYDGLSY